MSNHATNGDKRSWRFWAWPGELRRQGVLAAAMKPIACGRDGRRDAEQYRGDRFDEWDRAWYYLISHRDNKVVKAAQILFIELEKVRNGTTADSSRDTRTKERTNG